MLGRKIQTLLQVSREAKLLFLVGTVILVFLSIFTKSQASSLFEAMNSAHLSLCLKDVRPSVQKRWRTMAFSRVSTGDSGLILRRGGSLMSFLECGRHLVYILELRRGWPFETRVCSA